MVQRAFRVSDLIKNLRFIATREAKEGEYHVTENIDWMAADEIERLTKYCEDQCVDKDQHNAIVRQKNAEIERLTALVKVLESDDHEWYLQAARIERLQAVVDAGNRLYRQCHNIKAIEPQWMHDNICIAMQDFGKALAALEDRDER
jgi:hypothetical protein